jgi:hypothetical protein
MLGSESAGLASRRARPLAHPCADKALKDRHLGERRKVHERAGNRCKQIGPQGVSADKALNVVFGNKGSMSWPTQCETSHQHASGQQRKNLFHEPPGGLHPVVRHDDEPGHAEQKHNVFPVQNLYFFSPRAEG